MAALRQTSFLGGELDEHLHGRTDLPTFSIGLRRCKNFFVGKWGALLSRPGMRHLGFVGRGEPGTNTRLIPFVSGDEDQNYVLAFADSAITFWSNGAQVEIAPANPLVVATTYTDAQLKHIKYAQVGDVLTLTHPEHPPRELRRTSHLVWTLAEVSFAAASPYFDKLNGVNQSYPCIKRTGVAQGQETTSLAAWRASLAAGTVPADSTHPWREWIYQVTQTVQDTATGRVFETLPYTVNQRWDGVGATVPVLLPSENMVQRFADRPVTLIRGSHVELVPQTPNTTFREIAWNVYCGRGELMGLLGTSKTSEFVDTGAEPDYSIQPPRGDNPFTITDRLGAAQPTQRPRAIAFFQERRVFGGTALRPGIINASTVGKYDNYDKHVIPISGQALELELASRRREKVLDLLAQTRLLAFTSASVWTGRGAGGDPLDFDSVDFKVVEEVGSKGLVPIVVGENVLYARSKGAGVRMLTPAATGNDSGYAGRDVSTVSQHLISGSEEHGLRDWTYAEDPWSVIWACREDGVLLSMTVGPEGRVSWARHEVDGIVKSVCAIPEGDEDAVYLIVERLEISRIERFNSRVQRTTYDEDTGEVDELDPDDDGCVDACIQFSGVPTKNISGLDHIKGKQVWATAPGNEPQGPYTVSEAGTITLGRKPTANNGSNVKLWVGLKYRAEVETLDVAQGEARTKPKVVTHAGFEVVGSRGLELGQDFENLDDWEQREISDGYQAITPRAMYVRTEVSGTWNLTARLAVRQDLPLPTTLLALVREVEAGGA